MNGCSAGAYIAYMRTHAAYAESIAEKAWLAAVDAEVAAQRAEQATEYIARAPEARRLALITQRHAQNMATYAKKAREDAQSAERFVS